MSSREVCVFSTAVAMGELTWSAVYGGGSDGSMWVLAT